MYLPSDPKLFLAQPFIGPDDSFVPPTTLVKGLNEVFASEVVVPKCPKIKFDVDQ